MRKTNKNAFTLIELLAVIVILAIIALIAVPTVMNIITKANKSAFKDSAYGILKAGELYYTNELLEPAGMIEDKTFTFPNDIEGLEFNGSKPTGGLMTVNKDGKVSMAITNGRYCITKGFEDDDVTISDDITNCGLSNGGNTSKTLATLATTYSFKKVDEESISTALAEEVVVPACITNKAKCDAGTPVAVEVAPNLIYKFYVLNDDTVKNEVTLIMDRNLYSSSDANDGKEWISDEDYRGYVDYGSAVYSDKGPLTALKVLKQRTSSWTNIPAYTYTLENDGDGQGGSYTYPPIEIKNVRARLPRLEELTKSGIGCTEKANSCKTWLLDNLQISGDSISSGYWTSTANSKKSTEAWGVYYVGYIEPRSVGGTSIYGLRPVITLSK